ncbi:MAG: MBL fold metallo-hydrolase [Opitutaceae bacterium]|nr:MBL fold metallo-hydrolase [Opitutaceae bacterium]
MKSLLRLLAVCLAFTVSPVAKADTAAEPPVKTLRITVLSTMLTGGDGIGEWGFAALVEVNGRKLLFDTGNHPETVLNNAKELAVDLTGITDVVLSHNHQDHVGGLLTLRQAFSKKDKSTLSRVHIAEGALISRGPGDYAGDDNPLIAIRTAYLKTRGTFTEHSGPVELLPGVWFTGPIPRVHTDEQPIPPGWVLRAPDGKLVPDSTPDDAALVFDTPKGLVVLTGCGHAGLINTLEYARVITRRPDAPIYAATGGFHLFRAADGTLDWTTEKLRALNLKHLHGGHCTGLETVYRLRRDLGLPRAAASVAAVGSSFDLEKGIDPLDLAR